MTGAFDSGAGDRRSAARGTILSRRVFCDAAEVRIVADFQAANGVLTARQPVFGTGGAVANAPGH